MMDNTEVDMKVMVVVEKVPNMSLNIWVSTTMTGNLFFFLVWNKKS